MTDLFDLYGASRQRMLELARAAGPEAMGATVPACPDWSAHDLLTHCTSMPAALSAGDFPTGDLDDWIDSILRARSGRSIDELAAEWTSADATIAGMLSGDGAVLFDDLVVHEHDLRAALGAPDHSTVDAEASVPRCLRWAVPALTERGLGAIEVRSDEGTWRSHDAPTGWTLEVSPWEATRVLYSRRTADELRALGGSDDIEAYIGVLDGHLRLPSTSLAER